MKTKLIILIFSCAFIGVNAQHYDTLYNKTIVSLTKIGLPPQTIISKIQTSITDFDVSVDALIALQANGVNGDVINEMIKRNDQVNMEESKKINSKNPNEMHQAGIYFFDTTNMDNPVRRVDPTVATDTKSGGLGVAIAQSYTYGIAKSRIRSNLAGSKSRLQISTSKPIFYFYFENNENPIADNWFFATASSPNEFVCIKLTERTDSREMVIGSSNAYGSSIGIPNKIKVDYSYERISEGIYKVTFNVPLVYGEYCFLYASNVPTRYSNNKVFDFGIQTDEYEIQTEKKKNEQIDKRTRGITVGVLQGGGSLIGADIEFLFPNKFGIQFGAGLIGFGGGINFHFKPSVRSSFISFQYWNQGIGDNFVQNAIGPNFVFRGKKWFTFQLGVGFPLAKGPAMPNSFEQPQFMYMYSIGAYLPF